MPQKKGSLEYKKFKKGKPLTRKEAMMAFCYECNGLEDGGRDCMDCVKEEYKMVECPLYWFFPYRKRPRKKAPKKVIDRMKKMRAKKGVSDNTQE